MVNIRVFQEMQCHVVSLSGRVALTSSFHAVQKKLTCLLDSLLLLQYNLLFRHKGTHALVGEDGGDDSVRVSDEEVPSDLGSDEDSDRNEEAEVGKERASKCKRRQRKRKWPWVSERYWWLLSILIA